MFELWHLLTIVQLSLFSLTVSVKSYVYVKLADTIINIFFGYVMLQV